MLPGNFQCVAILLDVSNSFLGNEAPRRRPPRRGGSPRKLPGYQGIFIVSCLACLSLALASPLHLDLLHTATAEVEVDIPGDLFESVFIFINEKHSVPIIIKGDKPTFKTSVFGKFLVIKQ